MDTRNSDWQSIGNRVKSARLLAGYQSRTAFEKKHGVSAATLKAWENPSSGRGGLTKKGATRLIQALGKDAIVCSVDWLLYGKGEGPSLPVKSNNEVNVGKKNELIHLTNSSKLILRSDLEDVTSNLPLLQPKEGFGLTFKGTFAITIYAIDHIKALRSNVLENNLIVGRTFAIDPTTVFRSRQRSEIEVLCEISEQIAKLFAKYGKQITPTVLMKLSLDIYTDIRFATNDKEQHFFMIKSFISSFERGLKLD